MKHSSMSTIIVHLYISAGVLQSGINMYQSFMSFAIQLADQEGSHQGPWAGPVAF